jgi:F0F1-type ATP synthase assembly protein I
MKAKAMSDAPLDAHEHLEHAEHAAHANDPFTSLVSITIAVLAVVAAVTSSLETFESSSAIIGANKAVLAQDQATDQWSLFEAKSLKKNMYTLAADTGGARAQDYLKKAKTEAAGQDQAQADAQRLESDREHELALSETHEARHHRLTIGATLVEMAIALATIAIVTKKRWPWVLSATLGGVGAVIAALAYLI